MNRGLSGLPAGAGLTLGSLGDVQASPTSVAAPLGVPRAGDQPSYDIGQQKYVLRRGPRWEMSGLLFNFRPDQFARYRGKLAKLRLGTSDLKTLHIGDSTTYGTGSTDPLVTSWPSRFCALSQTYLKVPGVASFNFVDSTSTHWTLGSGWSGSAGQSYCFGSNGATGTLSFTPPQSFDTFTVYYYRNTGLGTVSVNVDGGTSLGTINTAGAASIQSQTFTCTAGTHTINIGPPTINAVGIMGVEAYLSTTKQIRAFNVGVGGRTSTDYYPTTASNSMQLGSWRNTVQPDLTVISLGINDIGNGLGTSDTYNNVRAIVTDALVSGDVLLTTPMPFANNAARDYLVNDVIVKVASDLDVPLFDLYGRLGSLATETANFGASGHLNDAGYYDVAAGVITALARIA